jgi:hypothetical protein
MGPTNIPPDAVAGHFNWAALPGFLVWAGVFVFLAMYAWYLEHKE